MNRKIKFRAFDKIDKFIKNVHTINFHDRCVTLQDKVGCRVIRHFEDISLMQYTGIKDKNDKEIYEGDIFITNNERVFKVVYDDTRFIGVCREWVCYVDSCYTNGSSRIEVIGNIHENKEMINND